MTIKYLFRWRCITLWCLLMTLFASWPSDVNAGEKSKSRFHALCVGLRYPGSGRQLRFTTSDVRAVSEALTAASGYDDLSSDIVCLVDDDPRQAKPTPDEVRRRLGRMAANTGPEDRLVFYFSGHGLRGADDRSILVCDDGGSGGDAGNLYVSEIRDILDQSPAKDKLLIIDACHSGGKSVGEGLAPSSLAKSLAGAGKAAGRDTVAWLASCDVSEQSWEDEDTKQGLFTRFFLEAVGPNASLADTNFDGMLSVPELNKYISNAIGHYIHDRKMRKDRDWLTRSQSPRMGLGGLVSMNGEELRKTALFYCPPDSYSSSSPAPSPQTSFAGPPAQSMSPAPPATRYDPSMTLDQSREFAKKGDARAQTHLGYVYSTGTGVERDYSEAARWYRLAADQGYVSAQYNLGLMYENGDGVPKDYSEAVRWYRLAADQGYAEAQYSLGSMYRNGHGVVKDYSKAERWYRLAADQGNASAQNDLGIIYEYENGYGIVRDYSEAVRWFRLAADQGNASGQYNLGDMYEFGKGVGKDVDEAVRLYRLAAAQGNQWAKEALERLVVK